MNGGQPGGSKDDGHVGHVVLGGPSDALCTCVGLGVSGPKSVGCETCVHLDPTDLSSPKMMNDSFKGEVEGCYPWDLDDGCHFGLGK